MRNNVPFLDRLADEMAADLDPDADIAAAPGPEGVATCPKCTRAMERFGYLGTNKVTLDRCGPCLLIWHDGDELGTTAALHARTTRRRDDRHREHWAKVAELNRREHLRELAKEQVDRAFVGLSILGTLR